MTHIVSVSYRIFFPDIEDLIQKLTLGSEDYGFRFIPSIVYTEKVEGANQVSTPKLFLSELLTDFSLYEVGTPIAQLKQYFKDDFVPSDLMFAKKAFQKLRSLVIPFAERVVADLCSQLILNSLKTNDDDADEFIFFIERLSSDKMLGRLGYLYLNLDRTTICFLSIDPDELYTTVISKTTGKLNFDLIRVLSSRSFQFGPYPGNPEDALEQAYFYSPLPETGAKRTALRFDLYSQGLTEDQISKKSETVFRILRTPTETLPHMIAESYYLRLPSGFSIAKNAWKQPQFGIDQMRNLVAENKKLSGR